MSKPLPAYGKKPGLFILAIAGLAVLLFLLSVPFHASFKEAGRLLDEFAAYTGLDRIASFDGGQAGDTRRQQSIAAAAETRSPEQAAPAAEKKIPAQPVEPATTLAGVVHSWPEAGKLAALTFDDGPSRQFTSQYLKVLDEHHVHATFFLIGCQAQENPRLVDLIAGSGEEIGNHSFSHHNLKQMSLADAEQDIDKAQQVIEQDSQRQVHLFRPPGGNIDQPLVKAIDGMGLRVILWNIDPRDWDASSSTEHTIDNVLTNLQPGSIILLHEGHSHTLEALPTLIERIRQRGYRLVTVSELLSTQVAAQPKPQQETQTQPQSEQQIQPQPQPQAQGKPQAPEQQPSSVPVPTPVSTSGQALPNDAGSQTAGGAGSNSNSLSQKDQPATS